MALVTRFINGLLSTVDIDETTNSGEITVFTGTIRTDGVAMSIYDENIPGYIPMAGQGLEPAVPSNKVITFADSPYTAETTDEVLDVDCSGGNVIVFLYSIVDNINRRIITRKSDPSTNTITIMPSGIETIDGGGSYVVSTQYVVEGFRVFSTEWARFSPKYPSLNEVNGVITTGALSASGNITTTGNVSAVDVSSTTVSIGAGVSPIGGVINWRTATPYSDWTQSLSSYNMKFTTANAQDSIVELTNTGIGGSMGLTADGSISAGQDITATGNLIKAGLTAGSVLFSGSSSEVSQDNSNLFWDNANDRLGVGTNTPTIPLQVDGGTDASVSDGSGYMVIGDESSDNMVMDTNEIIARNNGAATTLFLNAQGGNIESNNGNFVYDAATDHLTLSSTGDVSLTLEADTDNSGEGDQPVINFSQDGGAVTSTVGYIDSGNDFIVRSNYNAADLRLGANGSDVIWVDQSESVGIGASPETQFKLDVSGKVNQNSVGCSLYRLAAQSIANSTNSSIVWSAELDDTDGFHSLSSNLERITIPSGLGGKYMVQCTVHYSTLGTSGINQVFITKNGTSSVVLNNYNAPNAAGGGSAVFGVIDLSDGDYIIARVFQSSGSSRSLDVGSNDTRINVWRMGE